MELSRHMLEKSPNESVVFIVPTRALVVQLSRVISQDLPNALVIEVIDDAVDFNQLGCIFLGVASAIEKAFSLGSLKVWTETIVQ